jgi:hypothetical protein
VVGDTRAWKCEHADQVLAMVRPDRLERAEHAYEHPCDIFDAIDAIKQE